MPSRPVSESPLKAAVSVSEMAAMCGLSRSHFNFLIRNGTMPHPLYSLANRRPFYDREHQQICLRVKETNTGIDGRFVVFYARRRSADVPSAPLPRRRANERQGPPPSVAACGHHAELVEGLRALGMAEVTAAQVDAAVAACYPSGHAGSDEGEVLRTLWRHLRRSEGG